MRAVLQPPPPQPGRGPVGLVGLGSGASGRPIRSDSVAPLLAAAVAPATRDTRLLAAVSGVSGSGKTAVLDRLEAEYRAAGVRVERDPLESRPVTSQADAGAFRRAVLVDDVDRLPDDRLAALLPLLEARGVDLVVTHAPWPRPPALRRLVHALGEHHASVVLGPLSADDIATYVEEKLGAAPSAADVDAVHAATAGMPWLVQRLVEEDGGSGGAPSLRTLEQLGREVASADGAVTALLLALAVGFDPCGTMPSTAIRDDIGVDVLIARAHARGLLSPHGRVIPMVRQALLAVTPTPRIRNLQRELVSVVVAEARPLAPVGRQLARDGLREPRVAGALASAADRALATDPAAAAELYDEALAAGAEDASVAAGRAQAAAAVGDLDTAARLLDEIFARDGSPDLARAVDVAAAVWTQRGMLSRGAELHRWHSAISGAPASASAQIAHLGCGDRASADEARETPTGSAPPSLVGVALALLSDGLRDSLDLRTTRALPALIRSSDVMTASRSHIPLIESPAAAAAIVALQTGDLPTAETVLEAALVGGQGGEAARTRLLLLRGWTALRQDRPELAGAALAEIGAHEQTARIAPRDDFLRCALEVAIARRADDAPALVGAWQRARDCALHVSVDLFTLLPLGELVIAAARLKDSDRIASHLAEAWALLARLDDPPLWTAPLHWSALQAAVLAEHPEETVAHLSALAAAAPHHRFAALAAAAGRAWPRVLAGEVDPVAVETAARGLASVGAAWEGSRLAGHAAAHAAERKDMARLLACARDLHSGSGRGDEADRALPATEGAERRPRATSLSDRERQIARLVLDGKTYWEIGEAIFISPRTVEHHIARIRRRLGAESRSDLLSRLHVELSG